MKPFFDHDQLVDEVIQCSTRAIVGEPSWEGLESRISATLTISIEAPLLWLRSRQGLSSLEERVLWIMLAHELDVEARAAIRRLSTENVSDVSFDTLRRIVYSTSPKLQAWRELGPESRLRKLGYLERSNGSGDAPEHRLTFRLARRVLALAHGEVGLDPDLCDYACLGRASASLQSLEVETNVEPSVRAVMSHADRIVILHGRDGAGRRSMLTGVAAALSKKVLLVDATRMSTDRTRALAQVRAIQRECALLDRIPLVGSVSALGASGELSDRLDLIENELPGLVLATAGTAIARKWQRPVVQIEVPLLAGKQTGQLWRAALPSASESDGELLANMYPLAPALINAAGVLARAAAGDVPMTPEHIQTGIRAVLDDRLGSMARRVTVTQSWNDLVLAPDQRSAIIELVARVRERSRVYEDWGFAKKVGKGLGVSALFSGPPGTGKTMAAALIAQELQLELYQVDVGKITSKWIGETEKNLGALFDAAEAGHAVLLFDEADALFGKRSDVKSSNDRNANQEINYILQRMESFTGICILTTNHEASMDPAFQRRLSLHLRFQIPDEDEREKLWRAMLPAAAPVTPNIDFVGLARRFEMTGGYIRNAALRAAFLAADAGTPIGDAQLEHAARIEYEGMGKIVAPHVEAWPSRLSSTL